jgi:hypothetical protein
MMDVAPSDEVCRQPTEWRHGQAKVVVLESTERAWSPT